MKHQLLLLIKEATQCGARKRQACDLLGISLRSIQRWEAADTLEDKRRLRTMEPANKLTVAEQNKVLQIANSTIFCDLPPCQIVPILAEQGQYIASESTFYRLLKKEGALVHRGRSQPRKHYKPKALIATKPNQVWSWDITYLPSCIRGVFFYLYMILDVYSRKIVGWTISTEELSEVAAELMESTCQLEHIDKGQVTLHSDNGSPMKGATLLATLQKLGVAATFNRPGVSNDNPYSESLFKTLKYNRFYPIQPFETIDNAMTWVIFFVNWYNNEHRHSAIQFVTPHQRHTGEESAVLAKREKVYEAARLRHPVRWSGNTRNWKPVPLVCLNPNYKLKKQLKGANQKQIETLMRQIA